MFKDKLIDKFSYPILFAFSWTTYQIYKNHSCSFVSISTLSLVTVLGLIAYFRNEQYIYDFTTENGNVEISYQNNFEKDNIKKFLIILKNMKSVDFKSKSLSMPFHRITVRAVAETGVHYTMEFKTKEDVVFIKLLGLLKNFN